MIILKIKYNYERLGFLSKFNLRPVTGKFSFHPCTFWSLTSLGLLLGLSCIGFGLFIIFNTHSYKIYGDYCVYDADCKPNMNYVCSKGVCTCSTNYYYGEMASPCGKI